MVLYAGRVRTREQHGSAPVCGVLNLKPLGAVTVRAAHRTGAGPQRLDVPDAGGRCRIVRNAPWKCCRILTAEVGMQLKSAWSRGAEPLFVRYGAAWPV